MNGFTFYQQTSKQFNIKQLLQWDAMEILFLVLLMICSSSTWILLAYHSGLPEGTDVLSGVLAFLTVHKLPIKDSPNIPARSTNALHESRRARASLFSRV